MNALAKWLAKNGHKLTEPQREAAKSMTQAMKNRHDLVETTWYLGAADPKQIPDIEWLYAPAMKATAEAQSQALKGMDKFFPDWAITSKRSHDVQEMMDAIREATKFKERSPGEAQLQKFRYRQKRDLG